MSLNAETVVKAKVIYDFSPQQEDQKSMAISKGKIVATSADRHGCDAYIGDGTKVIDDPNLTVIPGLFDTHNHLFWTSQDIHNVDLESAKSISEIQNLIRNRAESQEEGTWIVSSRRWHESTINEERLPTRKELDEASSKHPILVRRGGHVATANSLAFKLAGIDSTTPNPPGGVIERYADGSPLGPLIEFPAFFPMLGLVPVTDRQTRIDNLQNQGIQYASMGLTAVRDPGLDMESLHTYIEAKNQGKLPIRVNAMYRLDPSRDTQYKLNQIDEIKIKPGYGDSFLKIDGFKIFSDGGVEGGWLSEAYANDDEYHGHGLIAEEDFYQVVRRAAEQGWKVGTHAVGDLALEMVLNVYERVIADLDLGANHGLVIEHAFFAEEARRKRAISLGIPVTVQHPLLYALGGNMVKYWGSERTREVMPVQHWINEGAQLSAGSDCNVAPADPLLSIWGMVTRDTLNIGVQGEEFAIDRRTALRLYTYEGACLVGEENIRGRLHQEYFADFVGFHTDLLTCSNDELRTAKPIMTWIEGEPVYQK